MINKCMFIGNAGRDPETRKFENGHKVSSITIACSEKFKKKDTGDTVEQTEWVNIVAWDNLAEIAEKYIRKGTQIYVEGKFHTRSYEGNDGVKRYVSEIWAKDIRLLGRKPDQAPLPQSPDEPQSEKQPAPVIPVGETDDLPF